jgi:hypothetical protein
MLLRKINRTKGNNQIRKKESKGIGKLEIRMICLRRKRSKAGGKIEQSEP